MSLNTVELFKTRVADMKCGENLKYNFIQEDVCIKCVQ